MKKVLILAYDFPPYVSVGALRPYSWYRYLKEYGVEPIVITRQWDNKHGNALDYMEASATNETIVEDTEYGTIIRTPYKPSWSNRLYLKYGEKRFRLLRKVLTAFDEIRQFIYPSGPKKELYFAAKDYLKRNKADVIITSGEPFILFVFANRLSQKFQTPWIADYRDTWSQNKDRVKGIAKRIHSFIEKRTLKGAASAITVSQFCVEQIQTNVTNIPFHILINGYNPEVLKTVAAIPQENDKMWIGFAGTIYNWHPWKNFLRVFSVWKQNNPESSIEIHFYGINISEEMISFIENETPSIKASIFIYPKMLNKDLMSVLKKCNLLLLFNDYSILGTKIFDYMALQRQIILCYDKDAEALALKEKYYSVEEFSDCSNRLQAETIEATNSGIVVRDNQHLFEVLDKLWKEFKEDGKIACNSTGTERYSRKIQTEKLAQIIQQLR